MRAIVDFFQGIWNAYVDFVLSIRDYLYRLLLWLLDWFIDYLIALIPQSWIERYEDLDFSLITDSYEMLGYLVPIDTMFLIGLTTFGTVSVIRLVRWIIGLIPTVEG